MAITRSGWIPRWSPVSGETSVRENSEIFETISPMWYKVNNDGTLYSYIPQNKDSLTSYLNKKNIQLIPTVAMFDYQVLNEVFDTQAGFDRHVESILKVVDDNDYAGIDLDYESILVEDKDEFFDLLQILSEELNERDKKLVVTVLAKWGDDIAYSLPQTREVQEWEEIAEYADVIRIMAYDYTYTGSIHPGPIGPLSWHKRILDYAVTKIPREKIEMGIHLYAYQWKRNATEDFFEKDIEELIKERNFTTASSYVMTGVERLMSENNGDADTYEGEQFFRYQVKSTNGTEQDVVLVYPNRNSILLREKMAEDYGIKGVSYWSLGGEEDLLNAPLIETETEDTNLIVESTVEMIKKAAADL